MATDKKHQGFTLIELMISIAIFGILAAMATPSFNTWRENSTAKAEAREVFGAFQRARSEAVTKNTEITLTFTEGDGGSWAISDDGPSGSMPSGISIDVTNEFDEPLVASFNSRGLPENGAGKVQVIGAKTYTISLSAAGSISME